MLNAVKLRCEYLKNPIGIGVLKPRFSWILVADRNNVMQKTYRLQFALDRLFNDIIWDSGMIVSSESVHIKYGGPSLRSSTRYFYRVEISDNQGQNSDWSETAFFETAMLSVSEWKAKFISPEGIDEGDFSKGKLLRYEFYLDAEVAFARVYATALGMYELYINGNRIGEDLFTPGWTSYKHRIQYQTYDVTDMLRDGDNVLGGIVGPGWYKGDLASSFRKRNIYGFQTGLLVQLLIRYTDGREQFVVTNENWKASDGPIQYSELYHGETYDARLEQSGWNMCKFNDSAWDSVKILKQDLSVLIVQEGIPIKRQETFKPKAMFDTPKGELVIDFGQNLVGWVKIKVSGNVGSKVKLKHGEVLDAEGNFYTANLRSARCCIEYILKGEGLETFEPHFTFQGFRYIKIEEFPGMPTVDNFTAVVIHSDMGLTGNFSCSNELINKLHQNILWGLKGNSVDLPTDCPQRDERLGWTGDAQAFIGTACYLMDTTRFFTKWLRDLKIDQLRNGGVPYVIPDVLTGFFKIDSIEIKEEHSSTGWGDASVVCPWTIYKFYGDKQILEEQYSSMKGWIEYIKSRAENGVLWNAGFHFGDFLALDSRDGSNFGGTPNDLIATAYYSKSTELVAKTAKILGYNEDAETYFKLHERIVKAFQQEFYNPSGYLTTKTQTAQILALMFNLAPEVYVERTVQTLIDLMDENDGHLQTGVLGTPYICHALSLNGKLDTAYDLLLKKDYPSWLYQITKGATTIWENWNGIKPDGTMCNANLNSFNHFAFGAIGEWLYSVVAGINTDLDLPGYKRIIMKPQPGGDLTYAQMDFISIYGRIAIKWKIEHNNMVVDLVVPHNTTARVILLGAAPEVISRNGVIFTACEGGAEAEIGSGMYKFTYPYSRRRS